MNDTIPEFPLPRGQATDAVTAVEALAGRNDEQAFSGLLEALNSPFWNVRKRAAEILASRGSSIVQRIQELFPSMSENQRHWSLTIVAWVMKADALPWLRSAFSSRLAGLRSSAITAVSEIPGDEASDLLMRGLEDDSWLNRYAAAEALERRGEAVVERLKRGFADGKGDLKLWSLQLLVRIFGAKAANFFTGCRAHEDADIRHYAIRALGETEDEWAILQLVDSLGDPHWTNRRLVSRSLVGKGKRAVPALLDALKGSNHDVIFWALQTLGKIGDEAMLKPILLLVLSTHGERAPEVREWAVEALGEMKTESSAKRLIEIANEFPETREKIANLLPSFRGEAVRLLLKDALSPNQDLRSFCRKALALMELPGAKSLVEDLEKKTRVELDSLFKAMRTILPSQILEVLARPNLDANGLLTLMPSLPAGDVSGISRIQVGLTKEELAQALSGSKQKGEPAAGRPQGGTVGASGAHATGGDATYALSLDDILLKAINAGASDIHLKPGLPPIFRIRGLLGQTDLPVLNARQTQELISKTLLEAHYKTLITRKELDVSYDIPGISRFRVNCFSEVNGFSMVARVIPNRIPTLSDLEMPRVFRSLCNHIHGLILICGPTGSGKSTTLAAMIDYINESREEHVLTIEDPIEFRHANKKCLITSRELGTNTLSFANALRSALREDPDIILVGELRDQETVSLALTAAETGHLVLSTLHTGTSAEAVDRIINSYPAEQQPNARIMLASVLRGIVCQMLVPTTDQRRVAVLDILIANFAVANLIREKKMSQVDQVVLGGRKEGMQSRDDNLCELARAGKITVATALEYAFNRQDLETKFKGSKLPAR